ncbi:MAG: hypothetical protein CFE23_12010 [Flavobacterium sp. BFFFF1]|uniref:OmpA family protein n=1 Tax=Flavobacterium sp. BFFFF1 TaxID=2015557 RepID=UPI000BCEA070|nr:OmpA family protein [Flavobacterium sp. BFFFF1]OYU79846.1 MAG: hypothetical protein CFE23_12010 [Flavobacterium sp. BFFFF1]
MRAATLLLLFIFMTSSAQEQAELSVYFDSGSHSLSLQESEKIKSFFTSDTISINNIAVSGYCDDIGNGADNLLLSEKRAATVSEYILSLTDSAGLEQSGKGELPLTPSANADHQRELHRKTVINVSYSIKPKTAVVVSPPKDEVDHYIGYKELTEPLAEGDKLILRRLQFISSTTTFESPEIAESELNEFVDYLKRNPQTRFEIQGHVCCITKSFFDARDIYTGKNNLSAARAKRIYDYFIEKGIAASRMTYQGFGRKFPREGVQERMNKRVEIIITQI